MDPPASPGHAASVQCVAERAAPDAGTTHAAARAGISGSGGALPHLDRIQQLFGRHDVSKVRAHVGGPAAEASREMGAQAYATGDHVAFRSSPDLHTAAHEAAHVVQQRGGVQLKTGVGAAGDSYEQHADAVADKVVRGESAEALLDKMSGGGASSSAVQLLATSGGEFDAANYVPYSSGSLRGTSIEITFTPNDLVVAPKLGLTQTLKSSKGGAPYYLGAATERAERQGRSNTSAQGDEGRQIDRVTERTNPMYGIDNPPTGTGLAGATTSSGSNGRLGRRTVDPVSRAVDMQPAWMYDRPALRWAAGTAMEQIFETTALAVEGPMAGTYFGSVEWGVQTAADTGVATPMAFRVISQGVPTPAFMASATNWNAQTIAMPGRIIAPGAGTVASREALVAGTHYPANTLVMILTTPAGPAEVRTPIDATFDGFLVAVGAAIIAGQQLAVYRTQEATVDLPTTDHQTVDPSTLSDAELEHRMRLLSDEILHMDQTSTDYQNKRFEIRALGRVAVTRGRDAIDSGHTYTVRSGDTLWGIAQTHLGGGARWTRIMALNVVELQDPNVIGVGATLKMPQPFAGIVPPTVVTPPTGTVGRGQKRTREDDASESNTNQKTGSQEST
jgi:LysM repeat protein